MNESRYPRCRPEQIPRENDGTPLVDRIAHTVVKVPSCGRCGVEYRWHDYVEVLDVRTGYMVYLYEPRCRCWTLGTAEGIRW